MPAIQISSGPLTTTEVTAVTQIWLAGNLSGHPFIDPEYWRANQAAVRAQLAQTPLLVARQAGDIVGFLGLQGDYIAGLFVATGYRDQGIGGQLLARAQATHDRLTLSVYHQNVRAMAFYVRQGFTSQTNTLEAATGQRTDTLIWQKKAH